MYWYRPPVLPTELEGSFKGKIKKVMENQFAGEIRTSEQDQQ